MMAGNSALCCWKAILMFYTSTTGFVSRRSGLFWHSDVRPNNWKQWRRRTAVEENKHYWLIDCYAFPRKIFDCIAETVAVFGKLLQSGYRGQLCLLNNHLKSLGLEIIIISSFLLNNNITAWKVSKYGVFSSPYFPVFSPSTGKYGPKKTHIWTLFTQCMRNLWELKLKLDCLFLAIFCKKSSLARWKLTPKCEHSSEDTSFDVRKYVVVKVTGN